MRGKLAASFGGSTRRDEMVAKLLDTPQDFQKFGFAPSLSGTSGANADPMKGAIGISTHLTLSLAAKVLSHGYIWAKSKMRSESETDVAGDAATWIADFLDGLHEALGIDGKIDRNKVMELVKAHMGA